MASLCSAAFASWRSVSSQPIYGTVTWRRFAPRVRLLEVCEQRADLRHCDMASLCSAAFASWRSVSSQPIYGTANPAATQIGWLLTDEANAPVSDLRGHADCTVV